MLNLKMLLNVAIIAADFLHPSIAFSQVYKCVDAAEKLLFQIKVA